MSPPGEGLRRRRARGYVAAGRESISRTNCTRTWGTDVFDNLTQRLGDTINRLRGRGRLTEDNISDALRDVRVALLDADVALPVVREFIDRVRERSIGQEVLKSLSPGQELLRVVRDELTRLMGEANDDLNLAVTPPAVILVAGLQGAGKTTSAAKLARWLMEQRQKKVLLVSCDVYRPAAIEQLQTLAGEIGAGFFPSSNTDSPVAIATNAVAEARRQHHDVVIVDTAGRLHIDAAMMDEVRQLHAAINPIETLFVVDSMTGQDAVNVAKAFADALPLTGVILTKTDGDSRGGAALSIRHVTGKPIKFMGVGEKTAALQAFHPDRMASRILGMGDMMTLIEEAEQNVDREKAEKLADKLKKGKQFGLDDFAEQLQQMRNMGGVAGMLDKLPGMSNVPDTVKNQVNDKELKRLEAIISSMTRQEKRFPAIIKGSRKRRIAAGSGTQVQDVNKLLKQFNNMQIMM